MQQSARILGASPTPQQPRQLRHTHLRLLIGPLLAATLLLPACAVGRHAVPDTQAPDTTALDAADDAGALVDDELAAILDPLAEAPPAVSDPFEPFNRAIFSFNDTLYFWLLKPLALGYRVIVPTPARASVRNFFTNLATPVRMINALFQLKPTVAGTEFERFILNSTIGVGGLMDPAAAWFGHPLHDEDMGQTLGVYGVGPGFYFVWPLVGPSSLRDTVGYLTDLALNPTAYFVPLSGYITSGLEAGRRVNNTSLEIGRYEKIKQEALDPYLYVREAYTQRRKRLVLE